MSPQRPQSSSGTEGEARCDSIDEKKRKRMLSNRESARRSRKRKEQHVQDLIRDVEKLQKEKGELLSETHKIVQLIAPVESENNVLMAQKMVLNERLNYLNGILSNIENNMTKRAPVGFVNNRVPSRAGSNLQVPGFSGYQNVDGADPMLRPWQTTCTSHPIMASSSSMFEF